MIELNWRTGMPTEAGMYFVAAELGPAAGVFDFMEWDGAKWDKYPTVEVIGYLGLHEFKDQLSIKWPRESGVSYERQALSDAEINHAEM